jgi:hypothetical protein
MKQITAYQTSDGTIFTNELDAREHESTEALETAIGKLDDLFSDEFPASYKISIKEAVNFLVEEHSTFAKILNELDKAST